MIIRILFRNSLFNKYLILLLVCCCSSGFAQVLPAVCQQETDGVIGLDRKDFNAIPGNTTDHSEGIHHNFTLPNAASNVCKKISRIDVDITVFNVDISNLPTDCSIFAFFVNMYTGCPSTTPASCPTTNLIDQPNSPNFNSQSHSYFCPPENFSFDDIFSVDIVPAMAPPSCTQGQMAISSGNIVLDYEVCVTVTLVDEMIDVPANLGMDQTLCDPATAVLDPGSYSAYSWSPGGQSSPTITVGQGSYTVTVTDSNGCTDTDDVTIDVNTPSVNITSDDADLMICSDGMTTLTANTALTNIQWSNLASGATISVGPGMYTVTVTDAANCTATDQINIMAIPTPPIAFNPSSPIACGSGTTQVTATSGYSTYMWSNSLTGNPVDLPQGTYTVTVTDPNNCTNSASVTVALEIPPLAGNDNMLSACNDNSTYDVEALLGTHDLGGVWSDINGSGIDINASPNNVSFMGIAPGPYNFNYTVTGVAPCPDDIATITVNILNAPFAGISTTENLCNPTSLYDFNLFLSNPDPLGFWSDLSGSGLVIGDGSSVDLSSLTPGTYLFRYEIPAFGGCQTATADLTINIAPPANAGMGSTLSLCEGSSIDLFTALTPDADLTGSFAELGGSTTLTGSMINTTGQAGNTLMYEYSVGSPTDPCGQASATIIVNVVSSVSAGDDVNTVECITGIINLNDYIINGDLGGTFSEVTPSGALMGSSFDIDIAGPGIYTFNYTVGDGLTCPEDVAQIQLDIPTVPTITLGSVPDLCTGQCEELSIILTGTAPFTYAMDIYDQSGSFTDLTLISTSMLSSSLTICNDGGGGTIANDTLSIGDAQSPFGIFISALTDDNCNLDLSQSMDTLFINAGTASIMQFDSIICMSDTIEVFGDEYFFGNDSRMDTLTGISCDSIISVNISFYQEDSIRIDPTLCFGDSLNINGTFYDSDNPIDTLRLTNVNGCDSTIFINLSFFPESQLLVDDMLCTGQSIMVNGNTYNESNPTGVEILVGQSENGCDSTVTIDLSFGASATRLIDDLLCPDESIMVNGNTYDINTPMGMETLTGGTCDTLVTIDLSFITNLEGTIDGLFCSDFFIDVNGVRYDTNNTMGTEIITDGSVAGCDSTVMIDLQFYPEAENTIDDTLCEGDSIIVNGNVYNVDNDSGMETLMGMSANGCDSLVIIALNFDQAFDIMVTNQICEGDSIFLENTWQMMAGTYTDVFQTTAGCDSIVTTTLSVTMCSDAVVVMESDNLCGGGLTGVISIDLNDGVLPIDINYTGLTTGISNTITANNLGNTLIQGLPSDTYQLTITDAAGTVLYSQSVLIEDLNPILDVSIDIVADIFCAEDLATLNVLANGGTPGFNYAWNDAAIGNIGMPTDLTEGNYSVTVTDLNNCTDTGSVMLTAPLAIEFDLSIVNPDCIDPMGGEILIENIINGTGPFIININGLDITGTSQDNLSSGSYTVVVQDANGCTEGIDTMLTDPNVDSFIDFQDSYTIMQGDSVTLEIFSTTLATTFIWEDDQALSCIDCSNPTASPSSTQNFIGVAINEDGCEEEFTITVIVEAPDVNIYVPNVFSPNNDGFNDEWEIFSSVDLDGLGISIAIYDRWGNQVYSYQGIASGFSWNGDFKNEPLLNGVYVYSMEVIDLNENSFLIQGDVTIAR